MAEDKPNFSGKWQLVRNDENYENFVRAQGAPWIAAKAASKMTPVHEIEHNGDHIKIKAKSLVTTSVQEFNIGEEFEETMFGAKFKVTSKWDGNQLVLQYTSQDPSKGKDNMSARELIGEEMVTTNEVAGVMTKRHFKRKN